MARHAYRLPADELADIAAGLRDLRLGRAHSWAEWRDLESDGILCLGYRNGRDGEHEHWPTPREALQADDTTVTSERLMQRLSRVEE